MCSIRLHLMELETMINKNSNKLIAETCDGASVTSVYLNGIQTIIKDKNILMLILFTATLFSLCSIHQLPSPCIICPIVWNLFIFLRLVHFTQTHSKELKYWMIKKKLLPQSIQTILLQLGGNGYLTCKLSITLYKVS